MSTDADWEAWGRRDPYFGVLTDDQYRTRNLTPAAREAFFETGTRHVQRVLSTCRARVAPGFTPRRILDFGCGTGRLVMPFAQAAEHVVGLDVSPAMLAEARRNCAEAGLENVTLLRSDDELSRLEGSFDLIHSVIVLQHIPARRGTRLFRRLLEHLAEGGIAALHVPYSKVRYDRPKYRRHHGRAPWYERARIRVQRLSRRVRHGLFPRDRDPEMEMNQYDLTQLFFLMQTVAGVRDVHVETAVEGRSLSAFLFFRRPASSATH